MFNSKINYLYFIRLIKKIIYELKRFSIIGAEGKEELEEGEEHHEKKSVLKKVKAKAKKIKDTITKHAHAHDHHDEEDEEDDEEDEVVEDPEIQGAPLYEGAAMRSATAGKGQHQDVGIGIGTTTMMHNYAPPPARREIRSRPSAVDTGFTSVENPTANHKIDDSNVAPNTTMSLSPWKLEEDPHGPKDPRAPHISEVKVHDPSNRGSEEAAGKSQVFDSFAKMKVDDKKPNRTGSPHGLDQEHGGEDHINYAQKISAVGSAVSGKAVAAKDFVASKLGYGETKEGTTADKSSSSSPLEYGKKIALTVTEKLKPGEEDRALSEVISEALNRRKDEVVKVGESAFGRPPSKGVVTESEELTRRLGEEDKEATEKSSVASAAAATGRSVVGMVKDTVGSWLGKAGEQSAPSQQSLGTSQGVEGFVDDSSSRRQAEHGGTGAEVRVLQGSAN
ncbi:hypothetical protein IC575_007644 [Cucumis melo]